MASAPAPRAVAPSIIRPADWRLTADKTEVAALLREFHELLVDHYAFDACQLLEDAANLPGPYTAPHGCFLLAECEGAIAGGFGLRAMETTGQPDATIAEAKRMYLRPAYRGRGLADALVAGILTAARDAGYRRVRLDSLRELTNAHALYARHGFTLIAPYNAMPPERVLHMECVL